MDREYNYSSLVELVNSKGGNRKVSKEIGFNVREAMSRGFNSGHIIRLCDYFKARVKDLVKYEAGDFSKIYEQIEEGEADNSKSLLIERAKEEYKKGKSIYKIGKELKIPETSIKNWLVSEGMYKHSGSPGRVVDNKAVKRNSLILEDIKSGMAVKEVADKYNLSVPSIYNIMKKNEVEATGLVRLYTDEQKERALEEYLSGKYTAEQVAKRTGVGIETVYALKARSLRKERTHKPGPETKLPLDEIVKLYEEGYGVRSLGNKFNASSTTIKFHLNKLGVYKGEREIVKNSKTDDIINLSKEGLSVKEICTKLSVSHSFVYTTLKEADIKPNTYSKSDTILKEWEALSADVDSYAKQKEALIILAERFSLEKRTVVKTLKNAGIELIKDYSLSEKKDQIVKLFKEGVTPIEIGSRLDCSKTYVYQVLEENGIERKVHRQEGVISAEDELEIATLYKDGKNATQLAVKYKTNSEHIYEILKRQGVEIRTRSSMSQEVLDSIISLTGQMMPKEIAEKLGISLTTVYTVQKKNNVSDSDT